jgi:hypothetical protein
MVGPIILIRSARFWMWHPTDIHGSAAYYFNQGSGHCKDGHMKCQRDCASARSKMDRCMDTFRWKH